jgi:hypothetical protein
MDTPASSSGGVDGDAQSYATSPSASPGFDPPSEYTGASTPTPDKSNDPQVSSQSPSIAPPLLSGVTYVTPSQGASFFVGPSVSSSPVAVSVAVASARHQPDSFRSDASATLALGAGDSGNLGGSIALGAGISGRAGTVRTADESKDIPIFHLTTHETSSATGTGWVLDVRDSEDWYHGQSHDDLWTEALRSFEVIAGPLGLDLSGLGSCIQSFQQRLDCLGKTMERPTVWTTLTSWLTALGAGAAVALSLSLVHHDPVNPMGIRYLLFTGRWTWMPGWVESRGQRRTRRAPRFWE